MRKPKCSWPGCTDLNRYWEQEHAVRGKCQRHGKWIACQRHRPGQLKSLEKGYYVTEDDRAVERARASCPVCLWDHYRAQGVQGAADAAEAERRNAEERRKHPDPVDPRPGWVAEFTAQGYGRDAAEAMAGKRLRENPPIWPERREWTQHDIWTERKDAELQAKRDAGEIGICPVCKRNDAIVSQGIVLGHGFYREEYNAYRGTGQDWWDMCKGEGSQAI